MEVSFLVFSALLLLLLLLLLSFAVLPRPHSNSKNTSSSFNGAPRASFSELIKNGHRLLDWTSASVLASPNSIFLFPSAVVTANPAIVEHILVSRFDNYPKGLSLTAPLRDLLAAGIFSSDGPHWRHQRKAVSPQFAIRSFRSFVFHTLQLESSSRLIPALSLAAADGRTVDLQDVLERFAFNNVCKVAFGYDPDRLLGKVEDGERFARAFDAAVAICFSRYRQPGFFWRLRRRLNLGDERRLREELAVVNEFADRLIRNRRLKGTAGCDDLISRFVEEGGFSDEFLRDMIPNLVLAGRDTTSSALTWFFWLVSSRPAVRDAVREELAAVRSKHGSKAGKPLTQEEIRDMEYLHAALTETMRLYPPVALESRECAAADVLPDGTAVKKGWTVMYNLYAMGRMKSIWGEDCWEFRPERWLENGVFRPRSPFVYPVFHAGPRMCLGKEMAYLQMKAAAAAVLEGFELEMAPGEENERVHDFKIVLRMKGGLPVKVKARVV